jgi:radical SAM superfamily enzyme YgiQ (UPF0313 family)
VKLLLITASSDEIKDIRRSRYIGFQQCTMPYLAAFVPPEWQIEHVDEECESVDFSKKYDLVAITFHTPSALHAYELADRFRANRIPVAMGGPHVTLLPEEAKQHADVIFVGEAETTWPQFLAEFERGCHRDRYDCEHLPSFLHVPFSRKELFHRRDHSSGILFATRGCPNNCEFCTISVMYKHHFRRRPVDEVASEFASFKGKIIIFWDDNLTADLNYAKRLFRAIMPYHKWWSSQASVEAGTDDEFLELAAKSGCKQLFIGLESVSQDSLDGAGKVGNRVEQYSKIIQRIHSHGIAVQAGIVFGFDDDGPGVFGDTVNFLEENGIQNATFNILTPYPGTALFQRLQAENRILTYDWSKYNARTDVVFRPKKMSPEELLLGFNGANRRFYSFGSIQRRLSRSPVGLYWTLPLNLIYHHRLWRHGYERFLDVRKDECVAGILPGYDHS